MAQYELSTNSLECGTEGPDYVAPGTTSDRRTWCRALKFAMAAAGCAAAVIAVVHHQNADVGAEGFRAPIVVAEAQGKNQVDVSLSPTRPSFAPHPCGCRAGDNLLVDVGVMSAPANVERRTAVRHAYLNAVRKHPMLSPCIRANFIIGHPTMHSMEPGLTERSVEEQLQKEQREYGDIRRVMVPEGYYNLPDKTWAWFRTGVADNAQFIVKVDDDMHLNMGELLNLVRSIHSSDDIYVGTNYDYSDYNTPHVMEKSYFWGWAYMLSASLARKMMERENFATALAAHGNAAEDKQLGEHWLKHVGNVQRLWAPDVAWKIRSIPAPEWEYRASSPVGHDTCFE